MFLAGNLACINLSVGRRREFDGPRAAAGSPVSVGEDRVPIVSDIDRGCGRDPDLAAGRSVEGDDQHDGKGDRGDRAGHRQVQVEVLKTGQTGERGGQRSADGDGQDIEAVDLDCCV